MQLGLIISLLLIAPVANSATWFVRADGGTRFSVNVPAGQCDGLADVSYASTGGTGVNQHCAFNDVRYLWSDNSGSAMAWVMASGDTAVIRGCAALGSQQNPSNPNCRLGYDNDNNGNPPNSWCGFGTPNTDCFPPPVPNGASVASITAVSVTAGVATITASNTLSAGDVVMLTGLSAGPTVPTGITEGKALNAQTYIVTSTGLSSSQFEVLATQPNASWTDTGTVLRPTRLLAGCAFDSTPSPCHTSVAIASVTPGSPTAGTPDPTGHVNVLTPSVTLYGGMGLIWGLNIVGSQGVDFEGIELTTHNKVNSGNSFVASHAYSLGDMVFAGGVTNTVTTAGTSGSTFTPNPAILGFATTGAAVFQNQGPNCNHMGLPAYPVFCNQSVPYDDFDANGFKTNNTTGNIAMTDMWIHGFSSAGLRGAIGGAIVWTRVDCSFNAEACWQFDEGTIGPNSTGLPDNPASSLTGTYITLSWNGCDQEFPIIDAIPCLVAHSQSNNGFGDGFSGQNGNMASVVIDHGDFEFQIKDPFFGPHTGIANVSITNSYAANNGGQTWKANLGLNGTWVMKNTVTNDNCHRWTDPVMGAPTTFNLLVNGGDMCRADGAAYAIVWPVSGGFEIDDSTFVTASINVGFDYACWSRPTGLSVANGGTGYAVNDLVYVGGGFTFGTVTSVGAGGVITGISMTVAGQVTSTGSFTEDYIFTTGGGSGALITVTGVTPADCSGGTKVMRNVANIGYTNSNNTGWNSSTIAAICYSGCNGSPGNSNDTQWTTRTNNSWFGYASGAGNCTYAGEICTTPLMTLQPSQTWVSETQLDSFNPRLPASSSSFYPTSSSPLIGAGTPVTGITTDFFGATRPNPPAIGGVEPAPGPVINHSISGNSRFTGNNAIIH